MEGREREKKGVMEGRWVMEEGKDVLQGGRKESRKIWRWESTG